MGIPDTIKNFIDDSPISLVASKGGPLSLNEIQSFYDSEIAPLVKNKKYGRLCLAGLMFAQDYIWEGHEIVQDYPELEASWWHAFMHRMEGDYGNAAYWYRRVGEPAQYSELFESIKSLNLDSPISSIQDASKWDPFEFNGYINNYRTANESSLQSVHDLEFNYLFELCYNKAV